MREIKGANWDAPVRQVKLSFGSPDKKVGIDVLIVTPVGPSVAIHPSLPKTHRDGRAMAFANRRAPSSGEFLADPTDAIPDALPD